MAPRSSAPGEKGRLALEPLREGVAEVAEALGCSNVAAGSEKKDTKEALCKTRQEQRKRSAPSPSSFSTCLPSHLFSRPTLHLSLSSCLVCSFSTPPLPLFPPISVMDVPFPLVFQDPQPLFSFFPMPPAPRGPSYVQRALPVISPTCLLLLFPPRSFIFSPPQMKKNNKGSLSVEAHYENLSLSSSAQGTTMRPPAPSHLSTTTTGICTSCSGDFPSLRAWVRLRICPRITDICFSKRWRSKPLSVYK